jgi:hypothetical protein
VGDCFCKIWKKIITHLKKNYWLFMSFKRNIVNYIKQLLKESLNCYCEQFNQYYQQKLKNKGKWKIKKTQQISFK